LGGEPLDGLYFQPTVLTNINNDMRLMTEETFGPVVPILEFETEEEVSDLAND